ncbi:carbohydrate ABC transporter permease [Massilia sp. W12]|uniref:carbohydrate ABC transporter permease n=1 Tax=Massilia sp. W12 TaxID=3126507 RepID=UPI0030D1F254
MHKAHSIKRARQHRAIMAYALVGIGALFMLTPFYFMFVFAGHTRSEIFQMPPPLWFGGHFLENMDLLLERIPFWRNVANSLYVGLMSTALTLLFCAMGGYAFAMYEFKYKKAVFALVMSTMLLPQFLGLIPTFMIMDFLGWLDQPRALYLPGAASAFGIFLMRQYIGSAIPKEIIEAARMDGCGEFRIFFSIVLPLIGPALSTLGLIAFIGSWNNFVGPLVVMQSVENYTLPLALRSLQSPVNTPWGAVMAGSAVAVLPLLVLFALSSRRLIDGLTAGAVKS